MSNKGHEASKTPDLRTQLATDLKHTLLLPVPTIPSRWLYDRRGSEIFEHITHLPEYYPSRTESALLKQYAHAIIAAAQPASIVELGAGTSAKTRILLREATDHTALDTFVPTDVDKETLDISAVSLQHDFPSIDVKPTVAEFDDFDTALSPVKKPRLIVFLGGTIGNFDENYRRQFFQRLDRNMDTGDCLLIGFDLLKDEKRLIAAYDDSQGTTAQFNLNVLNVINELFANTCIDTGNFTHKAVWNNDQRRIEMRLVAQKNYTLRIPECGIERDLHAGEHILTEISRKFALDELTSTTAHTHLTQLSAYCDDQSDYALQLFSKQLG